MQCRCNVDVDVAIRCMSNVECRIRHRRHHRHRHRHPTHQKLKSVKNAMNGQTLSEPCQFMNFHERYGELYDELYMSCT